MTRAARLAELNLSIEELRRRYRAAPDAFAVAAAGYQMEADELRRKIRQQRIDRAIGLAALVIGGALCGLACALAALRRLISRQPLKPSPHP